MLLQLIAGHPGLTLTIALALVIGGGPALLALATREPEQPTGRHGRTRGVYRGKPTEIRRHRAAGDRAWPGTISIAPRPEPTIHRLDETDVHAVRLHKARYEDTGEITQADLEALLGPRPAVAA